MLQRRLLNICLGVTQVATACLLINYICMFFMKLSSIPQRFMLFFAVAALFVTVGQAFTVLPALDKKPVYDALRLAKLEPIEAQLALVQNSSDNEKQAFEGALLMRKSGLISGPAKKLSTFKEGKEKLEAAIGKDNDNAEFRFLRLLIQENAPNIVKYKKNLDEDKAMIVKGYKSLPAVVQSAIVTYSKTSKIISPEDFK